MPPDLNDMIRNGSLVFNHTAEEHHPVSRHSSHKKSFMFRTWSKNKAHTKQHHALPAVVDVPLLPATSEEEPGNGDDVFNEELLSGTETDKTSQRLQQNMSRKNSKTRAKSVPDLFEGSAHLMTVSLALVPEVPMTDIEV
jgi:hypothetical protein